ncbi:MAG: nitronate monooxygenase [Dehalococcoidales bacterium]|nr:nitronate monooxygenase [Dehalococcoidales bacterium]
MAKNNILHTEFCDMMGVQYPIVASGMGFVSGPALVAAVSNAGGLGVLGAAGFTLDELRLLIKRTKDLTNKPFGVDVPMPPQLELEDMNADEEALRASFPPEAVAFANKFAKEEGIPEARGSAALQIFSISYTREAFKICLDENIPVFVSAVGDPTWAVQAAHAQGMKVMSCIGLVRQARRLAGNGVDVIIAQGTEAGGHTGRIGTMPLVPQVVDAIRPTPVLAAGGIADGRGVAAALALGAVGAWLGTAFVTTKESCLETIEFGHMTQWEVDVWKQKILKATEDDSIISKTLTGKTLRMIKNRFQDTWEKKGGPILRTPRQNAFLADLMEGVRQAKMADYVFPVGGQISGMIKEIKPAAQLMDELIEGASHALEKIGRNSK